MNSCDSIESILVEQLAFDLNMHFHEEFTVTRIMDGRCSLLVKNRLVPLAEGDVVLMPEYEVHACVPSDDNSPSYRIIVLPENALCGDEQGGLLKIRSDGFIVLKGLPLGSDEDCLREIGYRVSLLNVPDSVTGSQNPLKAGSLNRVAEYIGSEWRRALTLDELADVAGMSKYHLVNRFRREYGMTPHAYCVNIRINRARELLRSPMPLSEIALEAGFYDQSHFTNTFSRFTGISPLKYRKYFQ